MNTFTYLAAEGGPPLLLIVVGVVLVLLLLGAFVYGSRRARRKPQTNRIDPDVEFGDGGRQRGKTWQTIDDDPDQGSPHR
ncbi:DUF6479 family protein [Streptomyces sp. NPDC058657]|uniref:DUF6479 family protein n=1 Tax=unclassified Streptomyces TaxID=2593676 RepID=UPI00366A3CAC